MNGSSVILIGQIGKFSFLVEREHKLFWWKPWRESHIQRNAYVQDYSNYMWSFCCGWLCWSMESSWQKSLWGWNQLEREKPDPYIWMSIKG